jgi:hypothetical protein
MIRARVVVNLRSGAMRTAVSSSAVVEVRDQQRKHASSLSA